VLTSVGCIEAGVTERAGTILVLPAEDAHQAEAIEEMVQ